MKIETVEFAEAKDLTIIIPVLPLRQYRIHSMSQFSWQQSLADYHAVACKIPH